MPAEQSETAEKCVSAARAPARERLHQYLAYYLGDSEGFTFSKLSGDASSREYFRIFTPSESFVAAVYSESIDPAEHPYLDVTRLLLDRSLPVPRIVDVSGAEGIVLQEDLGDIRLQDWLETASPRAIEELYEKAVDLIFEIQGATRSAFERHSIASRLAFDAQKLRWELQFFYDHFLAGLAELRVSPAQEREATQVFDEIAGYLSSRPRVLTHRDFHSRNLMLDRTGKLRLIDHQDARMGPLTYDLVSLLWDPYVPLEDPLRRLLIVYAARKLKERENADFVVWTGGELRHIESHDPIDLTGSDYVCEREVMVVQRMLKAIGTYASQITLYGRRHYLPFIRPAASAAIAALQGLGMRPTLGHLVSEAVEKIAA